MPINFNLVAQLHAAYYLTLTKTSWPDIAHFGHWLAPIANGPITFNRANRLCYSSLQIYTALTNIKKPSSSYDFEVLALILEDIEIYFSIEEQEEYLLALHRVLANWVGVVNARNLSPRNLIINRRREKKGTDMELNELQAKIAMLSSTEDGEPLAQEMKGLQIALNENPVICVQLMDEDIGLCVAALRRMLSKFQVQESAVKAKGKASKILSKDILNAQISDDDF